MKELGIFHISILAKTKRKMEKVTKTPVWLLMLFSKNRNVKLLSERMYLMTSSKEWPLTFICLVKEQERIREV